MLKYSTLIEENEELRKATPCTIFGGRESAIRTSVNKGEMYVIGTCDSSVAFFYQCPRKYESTIYCLCEVLTTSKFNLMEFELKNAMGEEFIKRNISIHVEHGKRIELPKSQTRLSDFDTLFPVLEYAYHFPGIGGAFHISYRRRD
jgi:hypothetical protein